MQLRGGERAFRPRPFSCARRTRRRGRVTRDGTHRTTHRFRETKQVPVRAQTCHPLHAKVIRGTTANGLTRPMTFPVRVPEAGTARSALDVTSDLVLYPPDASYCKTTGLTTPPPRLPLPPNPHVSSIHRPGPLLPSRVACFVSRASVHTSQHHSSFGSFPPCFRKNKNALQHGQPRFGV